MRARNRWRLSTVLVLAATVMLAVAGCEGMPPDELFDNQPIDCAGDTGRYCAIAEATDALLIAYHDHTNDRLKLARSTDGGLTWSTGFLDWDPLGDVGHDISIAASGDLVAAAYRGAGAADLRCAVSTDAGATWHRHPVAGAGVDCQYTSTAISDTGGIFIAYHEAASTDLKLAYSADLGVAWTVRSLEVSASNVGQYVGIALNGQKVMAGYYDATSGDLRFGRAVTPVDAFTSAKVDSLGDVGRFCSLRYDSASATVWLAYHDVTNGALKIAHSPINDANWQPAITIDSDGVCGLYASLAVSGTSGQNLAIAYYEDCEYRLKVARSTNAGASWIEETVDEGGVGSWASIVATGPETYAVSFYDSLEGDLRLALWDGTRWTVR